MAPDTIDLSNFNYNEGDKINLYSQKIHKALDKEVNDGNYNKYCPDINLNETEKNDVKKLCKKIIHNLKKLSNNTDIGKNIGERCLNMKYWIYGQLVKLLNKNASSNNRESIIEYFRNVENVIYNELIRSQNLCSVDIDKNINEWKEKVILYDYFKNYDSLIEWNNYSNKDECKKYSEYVNSIIPYYKKIKNSDCCGIDYLDCEDYFKCDEQYNPDIILKKLHRTGEQTKDPPENTLAKDERENGASIPISNLKFHSFRCTVIEKKDGEPGEIRLCSVRPLYEYTYPPAVEFEIPDSTLDEGSENSTDDEVAVSEEVAVSTSSNQGETDCKAQNLVRGADGKCEEPDVRRNGVIGFKVETSQPINRVRSYISELNRMYSNSEDNISKDPMFRSVTVGGLSVGVMFTLFAYYKFTPLGSWMRRKLQGNRRTIPNNLEYFEQAPLPRKAPSGNVNAKNKRINIAYQSTGV
ncbi:VIR protein [Plasmodium vivax]|uniref:VIR protein n=1 Tax=Plasmodium vivax TaxID=5855 RepID=A0A1G4H7S3_PLAVI|nr:VIR protein [Plasmodium vivax]